MDELVMFFGDTSALGGYVIGLAVGYLLRFNTERKEKNES